MISQRMCVVCRSQGEKTKMFRVVKRGTMAVTDIDFKLEGRGAYICRKRECVDKARRARAFEKSLSMRIPSEVYDALEGLVQGEQ